jgi:hypothetical protein
MRPVLRETKLQVRIDTAQGHELIPRADAALQRRLVGYFDRLDGLFDRNLIFAPSRLDLGESTFTVTKNLHRDAPTGSGVRVVAEAPDGAFEAIELNGQSFALGVQWHPEAMATDDHLAIYRAMVNAVVDGRDAE